jgi:hypothetical protein
VSAGVIKKWVVRRQAVASGAPGSIGTVLQLKVALAGYRATDAGERARTAGGPGRSPSPRGAAHATGDEAAEHRYARELLARADADSDAGQRLR